ncbi:transposase [Xylocopilactobacillus apis]|uniref:Transposase IS204/IS1001/IS1096/IS1165 DDE domain-containing protein n=1 Tax=Xylocopilactobacillus apis TaxID=2932183 RepID=A0AAU9DKZ2_9LACO|nr:transposase [Xylocopilactobacillus apis]BDR57537.1 hypothetical protein KIMC2_20990 [Xylocopilactobacillus apis]
MSVTLEAMHNSPLKDIAERHTISASSVQRLIIEANPNLLGNQCNHLPEHLFFDEAKTVGEGYSFVMMDSRQHQLLEMLPSRLTKDLERYFERFSLAERQRVKTIVVDLNAAYISFIPQLFFNAEIIIDRFHLVQMPNRSVNMIRTKLMNSFDKRSKEYRKLKFNWRLILKCANALEWRHPTYQVHLRYYETQLNVVPSY